MQRYCNNSIRIVTNVYGVSSWSCAVWISIAINDHAQPLKNRSVSSAGEHYATELERWPVRSAGVHGDSAGWCAVDLNLCVVRTLVLKWEHDELIEDLASDGLTALFSR